MGDAGDSTGCASDELIIRRTSQRRKHTPNTCDKNSEDNLLRLLCRGRIRRGVAAVCVLNTTYMRASIPYARVYIAYIPTEDINDRTTRHAVALTAMVSVGFNFAQLIMGEQNWFTAELACHKGVQVDLPVAFDRPGRSMPRRKVDPARNRCSTFSFSLLPFSRWKIAGRHPQWRTKSLTAQHTILGWERIHHGHLPCCGNS